MIELVIFIGVALLLVFLLLLWAQRATGMPLHRSEPCVGEDALAALRLDLPPCVLAERIFSWQDWEFISRQPSPAHLSQLFRRERRRMALLWLRHTQDKVTELMRLHRRAARWSVTVKPAQEIKLAFHYLFFLLLCEILRCLIWLRGPLGAQTMVGYAAGTAEQVCFRVGRLLASLEPARLAQLKREESRKSVAI